MFTKTDGNQDEYLEVNVELKEKVKPTPELESIAAAAIMESLAQKSAEHKNNANALGDRVRPRIVFWPHNHPDYFAHGAKHKWVKRS
jgi:hypothetical protein